MPEAPLSDLPAPQRVIESEVVFDGHVWDVRRERFAYGDGEIVREFVDHTGAVAILAQDDDGRVLVIRQYRHPIATRDWELPAGLLDVPGEDPLEAAKRELAEEADLEARDWRLLTEFFTSPGGSNELLRVYLATGVTRLPTAFDRSEEEADIELRWVLLDDLLEAISQHRVRNGILVTAALALRVAG
ncbi:ADP-ribose pyrophosphatase [Homoserinimonas aerilata]|uniref:ADP-ribose pyrophosphatase n=1 Tax=Homoserinimonas aerilata TaxID=1162970 RepID=A0A542YJT9_9MICO|nr:NUDIX hydrolase [Homoserinimonas aerilata]TQL48321.1 ADP-ribose pyrophosphatase [Homoserinimonas aerilata]